MLYLSTALYCEAKPLITHFGLKKTHIFHKFQVFLGDDMILMITGVGEIAASVAIACVCSTYLPKEGDFFLSFGSSAALSFDMPLGELYLLNKITQMTTDKTFYPDIVFGHSFQEIHGISGSKELQEDSHLFNQYLTYDMEAASSYLSASYFFGPHQMAFLRMISDYGTNRKDLSSKITNLIDRKKYVWVPFLEKFKNREIEESFSFNQEAEAFLEEMKKVLHLSVSMKNALIQHVKFYQLMHHDFTPIIKWRNANIPTACKSKREGKVYFELLKKQLL